MEIITNSLSINHRSISTLGLATSFKGLYHQYYFNGSLIRFQDKWLFAYRTDQKPLCKFPTVYLTELDESFRSTGNNRHFNFASNNWGWRTDYLFKASNSLPFRAEDPRLFTVDNKLYMMYCDGFKMYYGEVVEGNPAWFIPKPPFVPQIVRNKDYDGREKNWTPFDQIGELYIVYCYAPFVTCRLKEGKVDRTQIVSGFK